MLGQLEGDILYVEIARFLWMMCWIYLIALEDRMRDRNILESKLRFLDIACITVSAQPTSYSVLVPLLESFGIRYNVLMITAHLLVTLSMMFYYMYQ